MRVRKSNNRRSSSLVVGGPRDTGFLRPCMALSAPRRTTPLLAGMARGIEYSVAIRERVVFNTQDRSAVRVEDRSQGLNSTPSRGTHDGIGFWKLAISLYCTGERG